MSKLQPCASMAAELAKIWSMALGIMPLSSGVPSMVWVLPLPVCPYANMHTLYPSRALWTSWLISSNTSSCSRMRRMDAASMANCDGCCWASQAADWCHSMSEANWKAGRCSTIARQAGCRTTDLTSSRCKDLVKGKIVLLRRLLGLVSWHLQGYSPSQQVPCITWLAPSAYTNIVLKVHDECPATEM